LLLVAAGGCLALIRGPALAAGWPRTGLWLAGLGVLALIAKPGEQHLPLRLTPRALGVGLTVGVGLALPALLRGQGAASGLPTDWAAVLAWFVLLVAPLEEAFFRGALYSLLEADWGAPAAVCAGALAFALLHVPAYGPHALLPDLLAGLLLGWLRWLSGGLAAPILAHGLADFLEMP
jgi:membrane protease YdiL (CAAX protease family)